MATGIVNFTMDILYEILYVLFIDKINIWSRASLKVKNQGYAHLDSEKLSQISEMLLFLSNWKKFAPARLLYL